MLFKDSETYIKRTIAKVVPFCPLNQRVELCCTWKEIGVKNTSKGEGGRFEQEAKAS